MTRLKARLSAALILAAPAAIEKEEQIVEEYEAGQTQSQKETDAGP